MHVVGGRATGGAARLPLINIATLCITIHVNIPHQILILNLRRNDHNANITVLLAAVIIIIVIVIQIITPLINPTVLVLVLIRQLVCCGRGGRRGGLHLLPEDAVRGRLAGKADRVRQIRRVLLVLLGLHAIVLVGGLVWPTAIILLILLMEA